MQMTAADLAKFTPMVPKHEAETVHIGVDEMPWVTLMEGVELQVLHVDLKEGLWVVRNRFAPGVQIQRHFHTGSVFAVTLQGRWFYAESPNVVNTAGSYLFEPAGSTHTLTVPANQSEPTIVWFAIYGSNIHLTDDDKVEVVLDAGTMLNGYRLLAGAAGADTSKLFVAG